MCSACKNHRIQEIVACSELYLCYFNVLYGQLYLFKPLSLAVSLADCLFGLHKCFVAKFLVCTNDPREAASEYFVLELLEAFSCPVLSTAVSDSEHMRNVLNQLFFPLICVYIK